MNTYITTKEELCNTIQKAVEFALDTRLPVAIREATSKPFLTKQELIDLTGWSSRTIQHMRDTNQIPYSQHGRKILYPAKGIFEFLKKHEIIPHHN